MFQLPLVALIPRGSEPVLRFTICKTVVQACQPLVKRMSSLPYTCVPPALSSCKPLSQLTTQYNTVVVGIVTAR